MGQEMTAGARVPPELFDDDARRKRTGTVWTTFAHIITAVIGSGVLIAPWVTAQLGWIGGPVVLFFFSFVVTYYTSCLLTMCYRCGHPVAGQRNYTYMEAVKNTLGESQVKVCGFIQYLNLVGVTVGYSVTASISMIAIKKSICFQKKGHDNPCRVTGTPYVLVFGILQIFLSQFTNPHQPSWLSVTSAAMSITYAAIGIGLSISRVAANGKIKGSLVGIISSETLTQTQKIWRVSQALGAIAFAYSYSLVLIEIQDTIKSPPAEHKTMKKETLISAATTAVFYMLSGCFGYAAFGEMAPANLLTGFGFYNPYWLIDIANGAIIIHLVGAYQVYCQPLFAFVENTAARYFPESNFINKSIEIPIPFGGYRPYKLNMFKIVWRTLFVCITTIASMFMPYYNDVVGFLGPIGLYPLAVYFPVKMYLVQNKILKWSWRWILLQIMSITCLIISLLVAAGSLAGVVADIKLDKPFKIVY